MKVSSAHDRNRLLIGLILVCLLGVVSDSIEWLLPGFLMAYIAYQFYRLQQLLVWARQSENKELPFENGLFRQTAQNIAEYKNQSLQNEGDASYQLERFKKLIAIFPDGVVILSLNNEIQWFNDKAAEFLMLKSGDKGEMINHLFRGPKMSRLLNGVEKTAAIITEAPNVETNLSVEKVEVRILPYGDNERLLLIHDVTKAERANQVRKDLAANISHELRTPLTVLKGYVEMLLADSEAGKERVEKSLIKVDQQVLKMQAMIESLLQLSKLENAGSDNSNVTVDMARIFEILDLEFEPLIQKNKQILRFDLDRSAKLKVNESSILMVLRNLINNAIHYTGQRGEIWVSWCVNDKGDGVFVVKDSGKGIPAKHLARLTERFYRVPENNVMHKTGTGLGLAIVKHELERYEAKLIIDSVVDEGSRFQCVFPARRVK